MKRAETPLTPEAAQQTLKETLIDIDAHLALNTNHDEYTLSIIQTLFIDMTEAVSQHGAELDEAIRKLDISEAWPGYLKLWLEQLDKTDAIIADLANRKRPATQADYDAQHAALAHREKISWRLWQCMQLAPLEYMTFYAMTLAHVKGRRVSRPRVAA